MTWRVIIPPDIQQDVWALPDGTRDALIAFIGQLRDDPDSASGPYGEEDTGPVRMRTAAVDSVIAVILVNDTTGNVTIIQLTHL